MSLERVIKTSSKKFEVNKKAYASKVASKSNLLRKMKMYAYMLK